MELIVLQSTADYLLGRAEVNSADRKAIDAFTKRNNLGRFRFVRDYGGVSIDTILGAWGSCVVVECTEYIEMSDILFEEASYDESSVTFSLPNGETKQVVMSMVSMEEFEGCMALEYPIKEVCMREELIEDFRLCGNFDMYFKVRELLALNMVCNADADLMFAYCRDVMGARVIAENLEYMARYSESKYFGWYMSFQHYVDDNPETTFIESDFEEYDCHLFLK